MSLSPEIPPINFPFKIFLFTFVYICLILLWHLVLADWVTWSKKKKNEDSSLLNSFLDIIFFLSRKNGFEQHAAFSGCQFQEKSGTTKMVAMTLMTIWLRNFLWLRIKLDSMSSWGESQRQWLFRQWFLLTGGSHDLWFMSQRNGCTRHHAEADVLTF